MKRRFVSPLYLVSVLLACVFCTLVYARCETDKALAIDGATGDYFGSAVSISGNVAIIGALNSDHNGSSSGSAYIFGFNGSNWNQEDKLIASDAEPSDYFGRSVSISDNFAIIGAMGDDSVGLDSGSAYIFKFNDPNWIEVDKLVASDAEAYEKFGFSVSIFGNTALVGACQDDDNGITSGSAYVFRFNGSNWIQEEKLLATDGQAGDQFGRSVSIYNDLAVIGASFDDDNGANSGSVYIFRFNGSNWLQEEKITATDGTEDDLFGFSTTISSEAVIVGAVYNDPNGLNSGSAYVFRFNGLNWEQEEKLFALDGAAGDSFGYSVSAFGDSAVIGAYQNDDNGAGSGSAYLFRFNGESWMQEAKLHASDGAAGDYFGTSVSISDGAIIVGAHLDDDNGFSSGAAYFFNNSDQLGDLDVDGDIDFFDFSIFSEYWQETDCGVCECDRIDLSGDGTVDIADLQELIVNWLIGR